MKPPLGVSDVGFRFSGSGNLIRQARFKQQVMVIGKQQTTTQDINADYTDIKQSKNYTERDPKPRSTQYLASNSYLSQERSQKQGASRRSKFMTDPTSPPPQIAGRANGISKKEIGNNYIKKRIPNNQNSKPQQTSTQQRAIKKRIVQEREGEEETTTLKGRMLQHLYYAECCYIDYGYYGGGGDRRRNLQSYCYTDCSTCSCGYSCARECINYPPYLTDTLSDQTVTVGSSSTYYLPSMTDREYGQTPYLNALQQPTFVHYVSAGHYYQIDASYSPGSYQVTFQLSDGYQSQEYSFQVYVNAETPTPPPNSVPYFSPTLSNKTFYNSDPVFIYDLPPTFDPDNNIVTVSLPIASSYISLISQTQVQIDPTNTGAYSFPLEDYITLSLSDGYESASYSFWVIIQSPGSPPNNAPQFNPVPVSDYYLEEGTTYDYFLYGDDPENNPLTFSVDMTSSDYGVAYTFVYPNQIVMSPPAGSTGSIYTIDAKVSDGSLSMTHQIQLHSTAPTGNQVPTFSPALTSQSVREGFSQTYTVAATDPEGQPVTITFTPSGTQASFIAFNSATNTFTFTPLLGNAGTESVSVTASDSVQTITSSFTLTILANVAPSFATALADQNLAHDGADLEFYLPGIIDPDSSSSSITTTVGSLPSYIDFNAPDRIRVKPSDAVVTQSNSPLTITVTVYLSDEVNTVTNTFNVVITYTGSVNTAPYYTVALVNQTVNAGNIGIYALPVAVDDQGQSVSTYLTSCPTWVTLSGNTLNFNAPIVNAAYLFTINLNDGLVTKSYYNFKVTVVNTAPTFTTAHQSVFNVIAGYPQSYNLPSKADYEGNPITVSYLCNGVSCPSFVTTTQTSFSIAPAGTEAALTSTMAITLTDGDLSSDYSVTINILENQPPVLNPNTLPASVGAGSSDTYGIPTASDPEGDPILCSLISSTPAWVSITGCTTLGIAPPISASGGQFTATLQLSDGFHSSTYPFTITVTNEPPSFVALPSDYIMNAGDVYTYVLPEFQDPENQPVTATASYLNGPLPGFMGFTGTAISLQPVKGIDGGIFEIKVVLNDGFQDDLTQATFKITINRPPTFSAVPVDQSVTLNQVITYTLPSYSDPEGQSVTLQTFRPMQTSLPAFVTFSSSKYTIAPKLATQVGVHTIQVDLTDSMKASSSYNFNVQVIAPVTTTATQGSTSSSSSGTTTTNTATTTSSGTSSPSTSSTSSINPAFQSLPGTVPGDEGFVETGPPPDDFTGEEDTSSSSTGSTNDDSSGSIISSGGSTSASSSSSSSSTKASSSSSQTAGGKVSSQRKVSFRTFIDRKTGLRVKIIISKPKIPLIAKISKVDMKGLMTVQFSEKIAAPANFTLFNDQFITLRVIPSEDTKPDQNKTLTAWQIVAFRQSEMDIQLNFSDPIVISSSLLRDRISLRFLANGYFAKEYDRLDVIKYKYTTDAQLPPQLVFSAAIQTMEKAGSVASSSMNYMLYGNLGLQIFMSVSMQLLWGMVNTLQLVIHMNMLSVMIPANVQFFLSFVVNIVNFKIVPTKDIINSLLGLKDKMKKSDVSPEFQQTGYESSNMAQNLGLLLLAIIGLVVVVGLVLLLRLLAKKFEAINKIVTIISRKLFFNSIIRAILEAYLRFCISTWLSVKKLDSLDNKEDIINAALTVGMIIVILAFPPFTYFLLKRNQSRLQEEDFKGRFESLYLNVNTTIDQSTLMMSLFVFRRLLYSINIVFLNGSTVAQLFMQFFCCLLMLTFFVHVTPMNQPLLNRMEIFNECCLLVSSYFLFLFTDFVPDVKTRYMIGWGFVGLQIFNIGVNWLCMIYKVLEALKLIIMKAYFKWKLARELAQKAKLEVTKEVEAKVKKSKTTKKKASQRKQTSRSPSQLRFEDTSSNYDAALGLTQNPFNKEKPAADKTPRAKSSPKKKQSLQRNQDKSLTKRRQQLPVSDMLPPTLKKPIPRPDNELQIVDLDEYDRNNVAYDGDLVRRRNLTQMSQAGQQPQIDMRKLPSAALQFKSIILKQYK